MCGRLGALEIECDAPPYAVVRACRRLGVRSPEDVRWCRIGRLLDRHAGGWLLGPLAWWRRWLSRRHEWPACDCGQPLPAPARYTFTFNTGEEADFVLAQCPRCRTVFWE